jgi:hypothetical protein
VSETHEGGCLCGRVAFRISGAFESFFLCHCSRCRKGSGSAHGANIFSSKASIAWLSGREDVATFRVPGTRHERSFCTACGSALPGVHAESGLLVVPAGCIDSAIAIRPMAHICCASRASWDEQLEHVPRLDALPG